MRLADGSRLVVKLNHSHTVADLRTYIINARFWSFSIIFLMLSDQRLSDNVCRPQYSGTPFSLLTTFPNKELTEDGQVAFQIIMKKLYLCVPTIEINVFLSRPCRRPAWSGQRCCRGWSDSSNYIIVIHRRNVCNKLSVWNKVSPFLNWQSRINGRKVTRSSFLHTWPCCTWKLGMGRTMCSLTGSLLFVPGKLRSTWTF